MKKEIIPPWLIVLVSFLAAFLFVGVAVYALQNNSDLLQGSLFREGADPGPVREVVGNIEGETNLPSGDVIDLFVTVIQILLALFSVFLTFAAIWSGVLFVGSFGDEEKINQAKRILIWSLVGVAVTAISYAFIFGITKFDWSRG